MVRGEPRIALEHAERIFALAQQDRDPGRLVLGHMVMGTTHYLLGDFPAAQTHLEAGPALYEPPPHHQTLVWDAGQQDSRVACLRYASWTLWTLGYPDQALQRGHAAVTLAQEIGHPPTLAAAHVSLARLGQFRLEPRRTQEAAEAVVALAREHGFSQRHAAATILWGWALAMQDRTAEGLREMHEGLDALRATGAESDTPYWFALLAEIHGRNGEIARGLSLVDEAMTVANSHDLRAWEAELHRLKGELLVSQGAPASARRRTPPSSEATDGFRRALDIARRQHAKMFELRAATSLARVWRTHGRRAEAFALLSETYGWFSDGLDVADLRDARALLGELGAVKSRG